MFREDYSGGLFGSSTRGKRGRFTAWQSVVPALALLPVTLNPRLPGRSSLTYTVGVLCVSSAFAYFAARLAVRGSNAAAWRLLFASILYLPLIFALIFVTGRFL